MGSAMLRELRFRQESIIGGGIEEGGRCVCRTHDQDIGKDFEQSVCAEISIMVVCQILLLELCVYSRFRKRSQ
jgi:hypothetical protein